MSSLHGLATAVTRVKHLRRKKKQFRTYFLFDKRERSIKSKTDKENGQEQFRNFIENLGVEKES